MVDASADRAVAAKALLVALTADLVTVGLAVGVAGVIEVKEGVATGGLFVVMIESEYSLSLSEWCCPRGKEAKITAWSLAAVV